MINQRNIGVIIKPISSLYDLLDNATSKPNLKLIETEFPDFFANGYIKPEYKINTKEKGNTIGKEIIKLNLESFLKDSTYSYNFIVLPYFEDFIQMYSDISNKLINYEYSDEIGRISPNIIRSIESKIMDLQNISGHKNITFYVPLYDKTEIEYRFQKGYNKVKPLKYTQIFNTSFKKNIERIPLVSSVSIEPTIINSIENMFLHLRNRDKGVINRLDIIQFYETLYGISRNKHIRDNLLNKSTFDKVLVLYSTEYIDDDLSKINPSTIYLLPNVYIKDSYINDLSNYTITKYIEQDGSYIDHKYKWNPTKNDQYKCIGRLRKITQTQYNFSVCLRELIFEDVYRVSDTINLVISVDDSLLGIIQTYVLDPPNQTNESIDINIGRNILKIFDESDTKLFRYNNIDKTAGSNSELYIPKSYQVEPDSYHDYLKSIKQKNDGSIGFMNIIKSPSKLRDYEIFLERNYIKLKNKQLIKPMMKLLFQENTFFHLKPRDNLVIASTQYKLKLDRIDSYTIDDTTPLTDLTTKFKLQKKYSDIMKYNKPKYVVHVNLLLHKGKQTNLKGCGAIKYKLRKHTHKLFTGGNRRKRVRRKSVRILN